MGRATGNNASQRTGGEVRWRVELDSTFPFGTTPRHFRLPLSCHDAVASYTEVTEGLVVLELTKTASVTSPIADRRCLRCCLLSCLAVRKGR